MFFVMPIKTPRGINRIFAYFSVLRNNIQKDNVF